MKSLVSHIREEKAKEKIELQEENKELKMKINEMMLLNKKITGPSIVT